MSVEGSINEGTSILDAASEAGVDINSTCGGKGTCHKCKVLVEGASETKSGEGIDASAFLEGYRLACQTRALADLSVFVPEEARVGAHKILDHHRAAAVKKLSPITRSRAVAVEEPTLEDSVGDFERVLRAMKISEATVALSELRRLPGLLRSNGWKVDVVMSADDLGRGIVSFSPPGSRNIGAAIDVGTTTVVLSLIDLISGDLLSTTSEYNRQMKAGDDVISRIAYAEEGGQAELKALVVDTINLLLKEALASSEKPVEESEVTSFAVAGNTTMIHLLLGLDPKGIRYEPYVPVTNLPPLLSSRQLGMSGNEQAVVYCVPGRAGFVGGDITADVVASGLHKRNSLSLLIDVGTNGEVVLGNKEFMVACSTSAGPAFEGGEVACGMRAMDGAIERVALSPEKTASYEVIGGNRPIGLCGSGMIDLVAQLFKAGTIDKKGRIHDFADERVRRTEQGAEYVLVPASGGSKEIKLTDDDLANILRTKAAVFAGCRVLLRSLERRMEDVERVYVAGGFGNYIDIENAITIGLLPDIPRKRFKFIGNAALGGAVQCLLSAEKRREAQEVYEAMTYLELSTSSTFFDEFSSASFLPHTDMELFPSVGKSLKS
ncbi:MAG: ASKHA domain-containing protein [Methanomassiliicoccales archaeon]|nr:ASKHA domain-containing protein [Methanomassiliicoccales archaeon]